MNNHPLSSGLDPEQQADLGDLSPLEDLLHAYETPEPDSARLLTNLQAVIQRQDALIPSPAPRSLRDRLRLAQMQVSLVGSAFWWASALVLGLGFVLLVVSEGTIAGLYALGSPIFAVIGTAYIFRPDARSLREFELLSAVSPLEMLYTRLLLILLYNASLALTLILFSWSQDAQLILWRLVLIWFGPMVGLTGVALYSLLRWRVLAGVLVPTGLWAALLFLGWREAVLHSSSPFVSLGDLSIAVIQSNSFLVVSFLALVMGLMLMWRSGRWAAYEAVE
ncbi:MAG: hypothetical protein U0670_19475 [Anaerolineae bacterium]